MQQETWDELEFKAIEDNKNKTSLHRGRRSAYGTKKSHHYPYVIDRNIYVELLLVVDQKMKQFYGDELENHVLTIMFLVRKNS
jgi:hypothetical protein